MASPEPQKGPEETHAQGTPSLPPTTAPGIPEATLLPLLPGLHLGNSGRLAIFLTEAELPI